MSRFCAAAASIAVAAAALAGPALAQQGAVFGHGVARPPEARALHLRLELADAAAVATIGEVGLGRIEVREAVAIFGSLPPAFELKRAPSHPPPLESGQRALLILRGARSPYLLVDEPHEIRLLAEAEDEARWGRALPEVRRARSQPRELAALYLACLEAPDAALRDAAVAGLRDASAPVQPLTAAELARLAELAGNPGAEADARRGAAAIAVLHAEGRRALLPGLPSAVEGGDPEVLLVALRGAALARDPELAPTLLRCLRDEDPAVRRTALQFGGLARGEPALRRQLERLATDDSDPELRAAAAQLLQAIQ